MSGVIVATVYLAASKILPPVVRYYTVSQAIFYKTVENTIDGYPVHLFLQFCRNTIVAQRVWLTLQ